MRNHEHKTRDMARSVLPSTARLGARQARASVRSRERADERRVLHALLRAADPDDFDGDLCWEDRRELSDMVWGRRSADKIAPIVRWAKVRIARDQRLAGADYWARRNYFAGLLGDTLAGRHALSHLDHHFGDENPWLYGRDPGRPTLEEVAQRRRAAASAAHELRERMLDEVLAGADARRLNARISALTPPIEPHWAFDREGRRVPAAPSGHEPWLFEGAPDRWLAIGRRGIEDAQAIAFAALEEVHAEMYGARQPS